jgi:hypothetical protein
MIGRYIRAFFTALRLTLRGQHTPAQAAAARYPRLLAWSRETTRLIDGLIAAADQGGYDEAARKATERMVEGRLLSLHTALLTARFHADREYPHLLRHEGKYALLAIQASNLNDRFYLMQLTDEAKARPGLPPSIAAMLEALTAHLAAIAIDES